MSRSLTDRSTRPVGSSVTPNGSQRLAGSDNGGNSVHSSQTLNIQDLYPQQDQPAGSSSALLANPGDGSRMSTMNLSGRQEAGSHGSFPTSSVNGDNQAMRTTVRSSAEFRAALGEFAREDRANVNNAAEIMRDDRSSPTKFVNADRMSTQSTLDSERQDTGSQPLANPADEDTDISTKPALNDRDSGRRSSRASSVNAEDPQSSFEKKLKADRNVIAAGLQNDEVFITLCASKLTKIYASKKDTDVDTFYNKSAKWLGKSIETCQRCTTCEGTGQVCKDSEKVKTKCKKWHLTNRGNCPLKDCPEGCPQPSPAGSPVAPNGAVRQKSGRRLLAATSTEPRRITARLLRAEAAMSK